MDYWNIAMGLCVTTLILLLVFIGFSINSLSIENDIKSEDEKILTEKEYCIKYYSNYSRNSIIAKCIKHFE